VLSIKSAKRSKTWDFFIDPELNSNYFNFVKIMCPPEADKRQDCIKIIFLVENESLPGKGFKGRAIFN